VSRFVSRMLRRKRTQPDWREQLILRHIHDRFPARLIENRMIERDGKELVRPAGGIIFGAAVHVDHIVKITAFPEPKPFVETISRAFGVASVTLRTLRIAGLAQPAFQ